MSWAQLGGTIPVCALEMTARRPVFFTTQQSLHISVAKSLLSSAILAAETLTSSWNSG